MGATVLACGCADELSEAAGAGVVGVAVGCMMGSFFLLPSQFSRRILAFDFAGLWQALQEGVQVFLFGVAAEIDMGKFLYEFFDGACQG